MGERELEVIMKQRIIDTLKETLGPLDYVYALWLEGSYANGTDDEYSDLDIWVDIADEHEIKAMEVIESALSELAEFDYKEIMKYGHPKLRQRVYHLKGTSDYLMIDFNVQLYSRPKDSYSYYENDPIEAVKVIFDKDNVIRYKKLNLSEFTVANEERLEEMKYRYTQHSRVIKYVYRGLYLEAFTYYQRYVLEPLVYLLRMIYTPAYTDYWYLHITQHIPKDMSKKLEFFAQTSSLEDIMTKTKEAECWFDELIGLKNEKESHN